MILFITTTIFVDKEVSYYIAKDEAITEVITKMEALLNLGYLITDCTCFFPKINDQQLINLLLFFFKKNLSIYY